MSAQHKPSWWRPHWALPGGFWCGWRTHCKGPARRRPGFKGALFAVFLGFIGALLLAGSLGVLVR